MVRRKGIIIYFRNAKIVNKVRSLDVNVTYVNEGMRYLMGYVDESRFDDVYNTLKKHRLVKKIEASKVGMEELNFSI
jgi:uncharacterized protein YlbG (UPF0298 family)